MMKRTILLSVLSCLLSLTALAQKEERETDINKKRAPQPAVEWMNDAFEGARKIQWYREETTESKGGPVKLSFEAKLNWKGQFYSVEFDENGEIEDIEIIYEWDEMPQEVRDTLDGYFRSNYTKHRIQKIQVQYTGSSDDLEDAIDEDEFEDITVRYEIEYYGSNDEGKRLWEGIFDDKGQPMEKSEVTQRPTDNLTY